MNAIRSRQLTARRGLTLVEVVIALTLLSTLIVAILATYGGHQRQLRRAAELIEAAEVADRLLAGWYATDAGVPIGRTGRAPGAKRLWRWRTTPVRPRRMGAAEFRVVRLDVYPATPVSGPGVASVSIEILTAFQSAT